MSVSKDCGSYRPSISNQPTVEHNHILMNHLACLWMHCMQTRTPYRSGLMDIDYYIENRSLSQMLCYKRNYPFKNSSSFSASVFSTTTSTTSASTGGSEPSSFLFLSLLKRFSSFFFCLASSFCRLSNLKLGLAKGHLQRDMSGQCKWALFEMSWKRTAPHDAVLWSYCLSNKLLQHNLACI